MIQPIRSLDPITHFYNLITDFWSRLQVIEFDDLRFHNLNRQNEKCGKHVVTRLSGYTAKTHPSSPWANRGPRAPPPWSSVGGIVVFKGPIGVRIAMLPDKKLGLTTCGGHFSKWPPRNLLSPISRVLVHVGSWFRCLVLHFLRLGIRWKHSWACQTIATCLDLKKV